jgi:ketosteroid isomerase-like protein
VREEPLPPVGAVISFIDAINRGDVDALAELMTDDHHLDVFDEPPLVGRDANVEAWRGYAQAFPRYVIYPEHVAAQGSAVAVLGYATGSHLGLPDDEERALHLIWRAVVHEGRLSYWQLVEDTPQSRHACGLRPPG